MKTKKIFDIKKISLKKGFTFLRNGFTFIEILICAAVVSILLLAAVAAFNIERRALLSAVEIFISDAELAQNLAMRENYAYGIRFNPGEYTISRQDGSLEFPIRTVLLPNGFDFDDPDLDINITPLGAADKGATLYLRSANYEAKITIELSTFKPQLTEIRRIS